MSGQATNTLAPGFNAIFLQVSGGTQALAVSSSSNASSAYNYPQTLVRIFATTDIFVAIGPSPVATAADCPLGKGMSEYFALNPLDKIAVISADLNNASIGSATGYAYITVGDQ